MLCSNCGNPLDPNDKFCKSCGTPINDSPMNQNGQMNGENPINQNNQFNPMGNSNDGNFQGQGTMMNNNFQQNGSFNQGPVGPAPMGNGYNTPEPKKNNSTFIIIVAVLLVIIIGLVVYFVFIKKDDKETPPTPVPEVVNQGGGNENGGGDSNGGDNTGNNGGQTTQVQYNNVVKVDDFDVPLPDGYSSFENANRTFYANASQTMIAEFHMHKSNTYNMFINSKDSLKSQLEGMNINVVNIEEKTFDGARALVFETNETGGNSFYSFVEVNSFNILEIDAFSKILSWDAMENEIIPVAKNARSSGSSNFAPGEKVDETQSVSSNAIKMDRSKISK